MVVFPALMSLSTALLSPLILSSSASGAGVAAAAGEVAKDAKHLDMVEKAGGNFIPLVVECFGVWISFDLFHFYMLTVATTTHSSISHKVARRNLLQQIFVCLWTNNARMILKYWAL